MINDITRLENVLAFSQLEPDSTDDLDAMFDCLFDDEIDVLMQVGANLVGAGARKKRRVTLVGERRTKGAEVAEV